MPSPLDELQEKLEKGIEEGQWPLKEERPILRQLTEWQAFREADDSVLRFVAGWNDAERDYVVDPIASRISGAFADLIFGKDPEFTAAADADQPTLVDLIEENQLPSELQRAVDISSSEGEVWWRIVVDQDVYEHPTIEWHSRRDVFPLYRGRKAIAAAFMGELGVSAPVIELPRRVGDDADPPQQKAWIEGGRPANDEVWRYFELQTLGETRNLLYRGNNSSLGQRVPLSAREETADLPDQWVHGIGVPLFGRVPNALGRVVSLGVSDYAGVRKLLLSLNEAATIGQENARLTLKQRVVIPPEYVDAKGNLPAGAEILIAHNVDRDPDKPAPQLAQVEWTFDADAWVLWDGSLTDKILTRARVAPQLVGRNVDHAESGSALRARLLDSILAADGKARYWDDALPQVLLAAQMVDALPIESGGFGRPWASPQEPPVVERSPAIPEDLTEEVTRHATAVTAGIESVENAVEDLHPDWDEAELQEEITRIRDNKQEAMLTLPEPGVPQDAPPDEAP